MLDFLKQRPPRRVVMWHAAAAVPLVAIVVLGGYLSYHYHLVSIQSRQQVDQDFEVLDRVHALVLGVLDADGALRKFVITGDEADLVPVQAELRNTGTEHEPLRRLLADDAAQLGRLAQLEAAIATRLAEIGDLIERRRHSGFEATRHAMMQRIDKDSTDQVRNAAKDMLQAERRRLVRRQQAARSDEQRVLLVGACIAALSVAIRITLAWGLARRRKRADGDAGSAGEPA